MDARFALAAAALLTASTAGGVALGSYTIGGFHFGSALEIEDEGDHPLATVDQMDGGVAQSPAPEVVAYHVCTGCDAHPYRDGTWRPLYISDDEERRAARRQDADMADGWADDEYANARRDRSGDAAPADDQDDDEAPISVPSSVRVSGADLRPPTVIPAGI